MEKCIVVATHPDDETFGAGGYLLKKKKEGSQIFILNITNMSIEAGYTRDQINQRQSEINQMCKEYQLDGFYDLELKPAGLDRYSQSDLVSKVSEIFRKVEPTTVILPYHSDVHSDHRIAFEICYSCTKSFRFPSITKILMMETPSETDFATPDRAFSPNYFVDISEYLDKKIEISKIFESEISQHPFPRSELNIRSYAVIRGATSNYKFAEAFQILKIRD